MFSFFFDNSFGDDSRRIGKPGGKIIYYPGPEGLDLYAKHKEQLIEQMNDKKYASQYCGKDIQDPSLDDLIAQSQARIREDIQSKKSNSEHFYKEQKTKIFENIEQPCWELSLFLMKKGCMPYFSNAYAAYNKGIWFKDKNENRYFVSLQGVLSHLQKSEKSHGGAEKLGEKLMPDEINKLDLDDIKKYAIDPNANEVFKREPTKELLDETIEIVERKTNSTQFKLK